MAGLRPSVPGGRAAGGTREEWEALPRTLLSRGSALKPAVWRVELPDGPCALKDSAGLRPGLRWLGRWLLGRERRILARLAGIEGVPRVLARIDRDAFALSWLAGRPLDRGSFQGRGRELADHLFALLDQVHGRGVFHLDVRQRQNVLLDPEGRPSLVDFGAALAPWPGIRLLLGPLLRWVDRQAVLKFLARYAPEDLTPEEARQVLRAQRWRRVWVVSPHHPRGESRAARGRVSPADADPGKEGSDPAGDEPDSGRA